jgi:hypothetical protein
VHPADPSSAYVLLAADLGGISDPQLKLQFAQQCPNQRACPLDSIPTRTFLPAKAR